MTQLIDADGVVPGAAIIAAGMVGQVCYISIYGGKSQTPAGEADHEAAGCKDAYVYEDGAADILDTALMQQHGQTCASVRAACGIKAPVVYWACDEDIPASEYATAWANAVMASGISRTIPGVYGPDEWLVYCASQGCQYLFSAAGWRGPGDSPNIQQTLQQVTIAGMTCDVDDVLKADYGQYIATPNGGSMQAVTIMSTPTGKGYYIVGSDGGVFCYGDAVMQGSAGNIKLAFPIVDATLTPSGKGYWLLGADGGIFAYGDAKFFGSLPGSLHPDPYS